MNGSETSNGWKWATLILVVILVALLTCLCGSFFGGLIGLSIGKSESRAPEVLPYREVPEFQVPPFEWEPYPEDANLPWLGVFFEMIDEGAEVTRVVEGSPADEVGLQVGDVIVEVDGELVSEVQPLNALILEYAPGDRVTLTVLQDSQEETIRVRLGTRPAVTPPMMEEMPFMTPPSFGG